MGFRNKFIFFSIVAGLIFFVFPVLAGSPSGNDWYQLLSSPYTGSDNTGDGGTGNPNSFNYYYVGQTWTDTIQIRSDNTNAANIWIEYDHDILSGSSFTNGTYFSDYAGITTTVVTGTLYRFKATGYRTTGYSSGVGTFGSMQFSAVKPTAANYSTSSSSTLDINIGVVGDPTESNISYGGIDILDDAEDFKMHVWADTKKPYGLNPNPTNGSSGFSVESNYTFDLRDSKNGEGDNTGVGTGVNTVTPPGTITADDGGGAASYTSYDSYSCSGVWGTNLCNVTLNPPSPLGISGDTRNWKYSTSYTIQVGGFRDYASASQDQLGDANGPNTMDTKTWTFTTEGDTVAPRVQYESPARGSTGNSVSTNLIIEVVDKKAYPGTISGTGVNSTTCRINVSSASFPLTTYQVGSGGVTVAGIDYGYRFTIDPSTNFGQNETVSVSVYNCQDLALNTMTTDNYTFSTADSDAPYVDTITPANDAVIAENGTISFHIKDSSGAVDLANTVIYVNGTYYTNSGGAGTVTTNGTRITFASSLNFNGGNYAGDTTGRTGSASDYTFIIDPQTNFATGEAVPVIIYTRDTSGNLMERVVYAVAVSGAGCPSGSSFCGSNTTWDAGLLMCLGTGGGSSGGGSSPSLSLTIEPSLTYASQINETSVLVTWYSNMPGTGRVIYGTESPDTFGTGPNYNYQYSTPEYNDQSVYHSIVINGLTPGTLYYFRPVTQAQGNEFRGPEVLMVGKFGGQDQQTQTCEQTKEPTCPVCESAGTTKPQPSTKPVTPSPVVTKPSDTTPSEVTDGTVLYNFLKIIDLKIIEKNNIQSYLVTGTAKPGIKIKMIIN